MFDDCQVSYSDVKHKQYNKTKHEVQFVLGLSKVFSHSLTPNCTCENQHSVEGKHHDF